MLCDICGSEGAKIRRVTRSYGKGKNLLIIEDIPLISCPHCGESYFTAETLHNLAEIQQNRQHLATKRPVEVAEYVTR